MIKKSVLLTALAIAGFAVTSLAQTVPNYVPTNGLVGWWPFNGNAIDESTNTNDGTVNGATLTADRFGSSQSALQITNNTNALVLPQSISLSNVFTLACWVKVPLINNLYCQLPQRDIAPQIGIDDWAASIHNGQLISQVDYPGCTQPYLYSTNSTLNDNLWHHIVISVDRAINGVNKIYIDGFLNNSNNVPLGTFTNNNLQITINEGNHVIDDIGIWSRVLTPSEITGLYNGNVCFQTITVTDTLLINTNITGFNPVTYQNTIKIWPNPTNDHITIDNGNLANLTGHQIKISNALGQQVFQSAITQQQFYVNMSTWGGNGIYFVNLINAQGVTIETRKIVLQ
jgi:hypothetical protein